MGRGCGGFDGYAGVSRPGHCNFSTRLCLLGLSKQDRMPDLVADHRQIADAVKAHDAERAVVAGMTHLGRLDETIALISEQNADYFEMG